MTSVLATASFLVLAFSGVILFVAPPGRIANWTDWTLLSLRKHEWIALHLGFSTLFLIVTGVHLIFNWRPLISYFKDRLTRRIGFRWEWLVALTVCGAVFVGTRIGLPPFSSLLLLNQAVKESWDEPRERAPIPHAELLTLAELAQEAGVEFAAVTNRLAARGVQGTAPGIRVEELARQNQLSAQQIYEAILAAPARGEAGHGAGQGRGGRGGGWGGGAGRKTLAQFCADEGIELQVAQARLQAKGINASAGQTMREIAVNKGYTRPAEILDLIRRK